MKERTPLPTLLSWALVAFTIEIDNEAERRTPHRTTRHGTTSGELRFPWLTSMAMWFNCMRYVTAEGITLAELERAARTPTNLDGMRRWGYIRVEPGTKGRSQIIRATAAGLRTQELWPTLFGVIEDRWRQRFGEDRIANLRTALTGVAAQVGAALPDCMPILGYGLLSNRIVRGDEGVPADLPLPALLARVLLAFALRFERESKLSMAICANILRVTGDEGVRMRNLPRLGGISKEAVAMATGFLAKRGFATIDLESPGSRTKLLMLTAKGREARQRYHALLAAIEERGRQKLPNEANPSLREPLEEIVGELSAHSPLFAGLEPYPDNWRAAVPKPEVLPHYPMVLHRGGYPDGS